MLGAGRQLGDFLAYTDNHPRFIRFEAAAMLIIAECGIMADALAIISCVTE
jgi:hypothetical protein